MEATKAQKKKSPVRNANHPKPGSRIKVEPIRSRADIVTIRRLIAHKPRDLCLFSLGINTAYRASELLSLTVGDVAELKIGDQLTVFQRKTKTDRVTTINRAAYEGLRSWLAVHPDQRGHAPLFRSEKTGAALCVSSVVHLVKGWCAATGIDGNFGSHTMRKTWGYHQLRTNASSHRQMILPLLMDAYGHSTQRQTLDYLCLQAEEVSSLFLRLDL
ncbi:MAG: tyrosine-type recombinase/integrase [Pseudomonadota bacterium]